MVRLQYILAGILIILIGASAVYFGVSYFKVEEERSTLVREFDELNNSTQERIATLEEELADRQTEIIKLEEDNGNLAEALERERDRNREFEEQIEEIAGTVGILDKLSKTDEELLQKYSRVYFLNEHYRPVNLDQIKKKYLYNEDNPKFLHADVMPFFEDMMDAAADDDIDLWVVSAFRSFDEQRDLKGDYLITYGSGSNTFSADQGYSEHQLGTTIDLTTTGLSGGLQGFGDTEAYAWLEKNAHEYGFVLSYPEDNQYYVYEPWHWRFVGKDLAEDLYDKNDHFYDWDQRDIDEYLISIFD